MQSKNRVSKSYQAKNAKSIADKIGINYSYE